MNWFMSWSVLFVNVYGHTPWGVLLSGGLDSTIVAALSVKHAAACRLITRRCIRLASD